MQHIIQKRKSEINKKEINNTVSRSFISVGLRYRDMGGNEEEWTRSRTDNVWCVCRVLGGNWEWLEGVWRDARLLFLFSSRFGSSTESKLEIQKTGVLFVCLSNCIYLLVWNALPLVGGGMLTSLSLVCFILGECLCSCAEYDLCMSLVLTQVYYSNFVWLITWAGIIIN